MPEVKGSIEFIGIFELLQIAGFNHRDLVLMMDNPAGSGHLVLADGAIIDAALAGQRGVGALFPLLMGAYAGTFTLLPPPAEMPQQTVNMTTEAVLMRVMMNLPQEEGIRRVCDTAWTVEGFASVLSPEELLQIFESNKKTGTAVFRRRNGGETALEFSAGGIIRAEGGGKSGAEAVYPLFLETECEFRITSPAATPSFAKMLDIPSVVMEGLRRKDENRLLRRELSQEDNPHVAETLERLERGELDEAARVALARRYLPGGEIAPAFVVARLTVDASPEVRRAAMETLCDLPEPIIEAFANDPQTPGPLLTYLLCSHDASGVQVAALGNPSVPAAAAVQFAPRARAVHLAALRERRDLLSESRELRDALRGNEACDFVELLDELDKAAGPKLRRRAFTAVIPREPAEALVLEKPEEDPLKEKTKTKLGPKDIQYIAKRGSLREKMAIVCGHDDDMALEVVRQPGLPESFVLGVAENKSTNSAALKYIAAQRTFLRNSSIVTALVYNPKTPVGATSTLLPLLRPDTLMKVASDRDLPDGTKQIARQMIEKRQKKHDK